MMTELAPYLDYANQPIYEGDIIQHPQGARGMVVKVSGYSLDSDTWKVDYGDSDLNRLCLQVGEKGQAIVVKRAI